MDNLAPGLLYGGPVMRLTLSIAAALALLAMPALGASQLEATRESATGARRQVSELRAQQMALRKELNEVAGRIEALKGEQQGKLLRGGELEAELRRSQDLSGSLTSVAQSLSSAEAAAEKENLALLSALSSELSRLRAEFDRVQDREARRRLISAMRALRAERDQVRVMLPATSVPALEGAPGSDDPEDLLEQADAFKDREDKVRRELQALEARIRERREERELDRRMSEFVGEDAIFDDQDRRFRLRRDSVERAKAATVEADSAQQVNVGGTPMEAPSYSSPDKTPMAGGVALPPDTTARDVNQNFKTEVQPEESVISRTSRASDARPNVGTGRAKALAGAEDDDLEDLEIQRARLKGLAEELRVRAKRLEERARELR